MNMSNIKSILLNNQQVKKIEDSNGNTLWSSGGSGTSYTFQTTPDENYATQSSTRYFYSYMIDSSLFSKQDNITTFYDALLLAYNRQNNTSYTSISNVKIKEMQINTRSYSVYGVGCAIGSSSAIAYNSSNWLSSKVIISYTAGNTLGQSTYIVNNKDWSITDFNLAPSFWGGVGMPMITPLWYNSSGSIQWNSASTSYTTSRYVNITSITYSFDLA